MKALIGLAIAVAIVIFPVATVAGLTACGSSLENRVDASRAGATLDLTGCRFVLSAPVEIHHALTLRGGTIDASSTALVILASHVTISGMTLLGPGASAYADHRAIDARGTAKAELVGVTVSNNTVRGWDGKGIRIQSVNGFTVVGNTVEDVYYAGIETYSARHGLIADNLVRNITGTGNAYGIALTRGYGSLVESPPSSDIVVKGNTVQDVPNWEGIDTHGGRNLQIIGNIVQRTLYGIVVTASVAVADGPDRYAPLGVVVKGNRIDSGVTGGSSGYGIFFGGARLNFSDTMGRWTQLATGSITANTIIGHGNQANGDDAAIQVYDTKGLAITGNAILAPSPTGISIYYNNLDFVVRGNTIRDPWSNEVPWHGAYGIFVHIDFNVGLIEGNRFQRASKHASYVLTRNTVVNRMPHNAVTVK